MTDSGKKNDTDMIKALAAAERLSVSHAQTTGGTDKDGPQPPPRSIRPWLWRLAGPKTPPADTAHIIDVYERGIERIVRDHLSEMAKLRAQLSESSAFARSVGEKNTQRSIDDLERLLTKEKARVGELERLTNQLQTLHRAEMAKLHTRIRDAAEQARQEVLAEAQATQASTLAQVARLEREIIDERTRHELAMAKLQGTLRHVAEHETDLARLTTANQDQTRQIEDLTRRLDDAKRKETDERARHDLDLTTQIDALKGALALARQQLDTQSAETVQRLATQDFQAQAARQAVETEWQARLNDLENRLTDDLDKARSRLAAQERAKDEAIALAVGQARIALDEHIQAQDLRLSEMEQALAQAQAAQIQAEQARIQSDERRQTELAEQAHIFQTQIHETQALADRAVAELTQQTALLERTLAAERQAFVNDMAVAVAKASTESQNQLVQANTRSAELERTLTQVERKAQDDLQQISARFADAELRAAQAETACADLTARLDDLTQAHRSQKHILAETSERLKDAQIQASQIQAAHDDMAGQLQASQDQARQLAQDLDRQTQIDQDFRTKTLEQLAQALDQLRQFDEDREQERKETQGRLTQAQSQVESLTVDAQTLAARLAQSQDEYQDLADQHAAQLAGALASERAEAEARLAQQRRQHMEDLASARAHVGEDVQLRLAEVQATIETLMRQRGEETLAHAQAVEAARAQGAAEARMDSDADLAILRERVGSLESTLREREIELSRLHGGMDEELSRIRAEQSHDRTQATQTLTHDLMTAKADLTAAKERIAKLESDLAKAPRRSLFGGSGPSQADLNEALARAEDAEERAKLAENKVDLLKDALEITKTRASQTSTAPMGTGAADRRFREAKRAFARQFHPDQGGRGDPEKERLFADFWPILERIDRGG